LSSNRLRR